MTDIEQQARKEVIGVAVWRGEIIEVCQVDEARPINCDLVHRAIYVDEQGRRCTIWPRPGEVYLFKPSLMVGFSEEEIERIPREEWSAMLTAAGVPEPHSEPDNRFLLGGNLALRYANTRSVSIDRIMEVAREYVPDDQWEDLRSRLESLLENFKA